MCKDRRPFTLMELLLCIFLITLIAIPLSRNPVYLFKQEITLLRELELSRLADVAFVEALSQPLPEWEKMREGVHYTLKPQSLTLEGIHTTVFTPTVSVNVARPQEELGEHTRLLKYTITLLPDKKIYS